jgi:hypothetical protein
MSAKIASASTNTVRCGVGAAHIFRKSWDILFLIAELV